jgi:hypothetical protein
VISFLQISPEVAALKIKEIENKLEARSDLPARSHRLVAGGDLPAPREKFPLRGSQSRTTFFFRMEEAPPTSSSTGM